MPYSKSDRRAILFLSIIAVLIVGGIIVSSQWGRIGWKETTKTPLPEDSCSVDSVSENICPPDHFDPNTVDSATLISLGLKPYQVKGFMNYRNAGAVFRTPNDITRVYLLEDENIDSLLPRIRIDRKYSERRTKYPLRQEGNREAFDHEKHEYNRPDGFKGNGDEARENARPAYPQKFKTLTKVDVNSADTALLMRIPTIGSGRAKAIVERRDKLRGFANVEQLLEIGIFPADMIEWFEVATPHERMEINKASFNQLMKHPYIGYDKAKKLSNYIRLYGPIKDIETLESTNIFSRTEIEHLQPYLQF